MINKYYIQNIEQIKDAFHNNKEFPHVVLVDFFEKKDYEMIKQEIKRTTFSPEKDPLTHSYSIARTTFLNDPFFEFVSTIVNGNIKPMKQTILQFKHKDYTILNDQQQDKPGVDIIFNVTDDWQDEWGGSHFYVDGSGAYTKMLTTGNTLVMARRSADTKRFVKYVNCTSKQKSRIFIIMSTS
ncbi:hypothetical protein J4228_02560 [Candidatus Woesearchaeota archaeon]|nr:hypothetical protein [Candidatus Woesearchaeota archaeon]